MIGKCFCVEIYGSDLSEQILINGVELRTVSITRSGGLSSFHVEFPEINNFSDGLIVDINQTIYDMIVTNGNLHGINYELFGFKDSWIDIDITYEVTYSSDRLLSLRFFGAITGGGVGARGFADIQKAITIDMNTGDVLSLGDFFTYAEMQDMIENLFASEYSFIMGQHHNLSDSKDEQWRLELLKDLEGHFYNLLINDKLLNDTRYFYIREDRVGLIASLATPRDSVVIEIYVGQISHI